MPLRPVCSKMTGEGGQAEAHGHRQAPGETEETHEIQNDTKDGGRAAGAPPAVLLRAEGPRSQSRAAAGDGGPDRCTGRHGGADGAAGNNGRALCSRPERRWGAHRDPVSGRDPRRRGFQRDGVVSVRHGAVPRKSRPPCRNGGRERSRGDLPMAAYRVFPHLHTGRDRMDPLLCLRDRRGFGRLPDYRRASDLRRRYAQLCRFHGT